MRILFHVHALKTGGAERQLVYLARGLAARGHQIHVVTLYEGGPLWRELAGSENLRLYSLSRKSRWDFSVIWKLARYLKENRIALVQGWMPPCNSLSALSGHLCGVPTFMAIRASNMDYPLGGKLYAAADYLAARLLTKRVVYNSFAGRDYYLDRGYPARGYHVIPNGTDRPKNYTFSPPFTGSTPRIVGMLSRLDPMKDHTVMFSALKMLIDRGLSVRLLVFGKGDTHWESHLVQKASDLKLEKFISWCGWSDDPWNALAQMDILVSSSKGEGMSNTILEGMLAGRSIVATDVGDTRRLLRVEADRCGWVVPPSDPSQLASCLEEVLADIEQSKQIARHAQEIAELNYGVNRMIDEYEKLYRKFLNV